MDELAEDDKEVEALAHYQILKTYPTAETGTVKFDWPNKWLKGDEYFHILSHADSYIKEFKFGTYPSKTHPFTTYTDPISIGWYKCRWRYVLCRRAFCWLGIRFS